MGILQNIFKKKEAVEPVKSVKSFKAARQTLMKGSFGSVKKKLDSDLLVDQKYLVSVARDLEKNNAIMKKYLNMVETNIVGPEGFLLVSQGADYTASGEAVLDTVGNNIIEEHFTKWSQARYCDVTGKQSFKEIQRLLSKTLKRDGEILIKFITEKATKQNPFGFSLQVLDPQRIDENLNTILSNGNIIIMGVEMSVEGKVIAYHLKKQTATNMLTTNTLISGDNERIPADQIIHKFKHMSQEQTRGVPEGHAVFETMTHLEDFLETALIASKVGAASSLFLEKSDDSDLNAVDQIADSVSDDVVPEFYAELDPGTIRELPKGTTLKSFQSNYPEASFNPYVQLMLKQIASGLNVSYFVLANSLENVNYTSSRTGLLEERDGWKREQSWFIENIIEPIYEKFLEIAFLNNAIKFPNGSILPITKLDKFQNNYRFYGRRWDWVDPLKDTNASILQIQNGLTSLTRVLAEKGIEFEDILIEKKKEQELKAKYGLSDTSETSIINSIDEEDN